MVGKPTSMVSSTAVAAMLERGTRPVLILFQYQSNYRNIGSKRLKAWFKHGKSNLYHLVI